MIRFTMVRYDILMLRTRAEEPMTFVQDLNGRGRAKFVLLDLLRFCPR